MRVERVPVFLEVADGVAHRVRVFAEEEALAGRVPGDRVAGAAGGGLQRRGGARLHVAQLSALLQPLDGRIHRRVDVGVRVAALPVHGARRVNRLHRRDRVAEAVAVAGLVAHRPDGDGRVVAVEHGVALVALDDGVVPLGMKPEAVLAVARLMSLDVRLRDDVDAVAVAEVVPEVMVRIVRGADGVDVVALEERDVRHHLVERDGAAVLRAGLVAVHALELDGLAVDEERVADDLLLLEADLLRADVVALLQDERVEVGFFRRPEVNVRDLQRLQAARERADEPLLGVIERRVRKVAPGDGERRGLVVARERRLDREVPDAVLRLRPERDVAEDAGVAQHVLVFDEAAVAPAVDLDGEGVQGGGGGRRWRKDVILPLSTSTSSLHLQVLRDVELGRELRVLGVADELSVDPDVVGGVDAVEAQDDVATLPAVRHGERRAVGRDGVVVARVRVAVADRRGLDVAFRVPGVGIAPVRVAGHAEAAHLDAARDVDREPVGVVEVRLPEVLDAQVGVARPRDLPDAVEALLERGLRVEGVRERGSLVRERHRVGARGEAVAGVDLQVLPVVRRWRGERGAGEQRRGHGRQESCHVACLSSFG